MSHRSQYGFLLGGAGWPYLLTSHFEGVAGTGQTYKKVIRNVQQGMAQSLDLSTGITDLGGTTIQITNGEFLLNDRKSSPATSLTATINATDTTITVADNSAFPLSGVIWIEQEAIAYSGKSGSTQFTGCTRGYFSSTARSHGLNFIVYGYHPTILGSKVALYWIPLHDLANFSDWTIRYWGTVEAFEFNDSGAVISIVSNQRKIKNAKICAPAFARGALRDEIKRPAKQISRSTSRQAPPESLIIELANKTAPFPDYRSNYTKILPRGGALRIDDELIQYIAAKHPLYSFQIASSAATDRFTFSIATLSDLRAYYELKEGDLFDLQDSSGGVITGGEGLQINSITQSATPAAVGTTITILHNGNTSPTASHYMAANYLQKIYVRNQIRGYLNTPAGPHKSGASVQEVRILEGDAINVLLACLFSVDGDNTAGPGSGLFDVLPNEWGLALDSADVDLDSFVSLSNRSYPIRYVLTDAINAEDLTRWIGFFVNAVFAWDQDGVFRARRQSDIYPGDTATHTIGSSQISGGSVPQMILDYNTILNSFSLPSDFNLDGEPMTSLSVIDAESIGVYGRRPLETEENTGIVSARSWSVLYESLLALAYYRSRPQPVITLDALFDLGKEYRIGQSVSLTLANLPDVQGSTGYAAKTFNILEVSPNESSGLVSLRLIGRPVNDNLGRVSFAGVVQSIAGTVITLEPASVSRLAPTISPIQAPLSNLAGTEDVEWFYENDAITFWDVSSMGTSGDPVFSYDTTISAVDYGARQITVAGVPSLWTLAAGDLVRLDRWQDEGATANGASRQSFFLALADNSTELLGGADAAFKWGS